MANIEKHKLTFVSADKPFTSRDGKELTRFYIKTEELGDEILLSGLRNHGNQAWKKGDTVDLVVEKKELDGKTFWNFSNPKAPTVNQEQLDKVERLLLDHIHDTSLHGAAPIQETMTEDPEMPF